MFKQLSLLVAGVLLLAACTTNPYTGEQEASNKAKVAAIGAAVGALSGTAVGACMDAQESRQRDQLRSSGVSVTRMGNDVVLNMPGNITFDVSRSDLRGDFVPVLDSVSRVLTE